MMIAVIARSALITLLLGMSGVASANHDYYPGDGGYGYDEGYGYDRPYDQDRYYGGSQRLRCESNDSRTRFCRADTRRGVRLVSQLSRSACIEGRSWGWDRGGIWVSRGCRGVFLTGAYRRGYDSRYGDYGYNPARRLVCESHEGRYNVCRSYGFVREARITRQLSDSSCRYNYSWGYRGDGIWVDRGCRAEFLVY